MLSSINLSQIISMKKSLLPSLNILYMMLLVSFTAVKKGRYTLERRAETIMESRKYWTTKTESTTPTTNTQPTASSKPAPADSEAIAKYLFSSNIQNQTEHQSDIQPAPGVRPGKRSSHSFSSTSSSFDSDSGLNLQDDLISSESMLSLLTNNDPIMLESETAMDIPENKQPINDVFMPKSMYTSKCTDNNALKSLLAIPSSPYYKAATPDTTTTDSDLNAAENSALLSNLHEFPEDVIPDTTNMANLETQLLSNNVNEATNEEQMSQILGNFSAHVPSIQASSDTEILASIVGRDSPNRDGEQKDSQSVIDKLLGLKTLFKDPKNTTEFKTDYLKGFSTEKQDCESVESLFNSIRHPADALDIALAKADDENLSKLIDQTIEAFDKQNFLTRGFLAKLPDYQHRFLVRTSSCTIHFE